MEQVAAAVQVSPIQALMEEEALEALEVTAVRVVRGEAGGQIAVPSELGVVVVVVVELDVMF
jgi:hypothetical protein